MDVISECEERFNIDPDRVFLFGHSMGGFGGYHQALRGPDRFASIIISSGPGTAATGRSYEARRCHRPGRE